jgi:hypothetical protein
LNAQLLSAPGFYGTVYGLMVEGPGSRYQLEIASRAAAICPTHLRIVVKQGAGWLPGFCFGPLGDFAEQKMG